RAATSSVPHWKDTTTTLSAIIACCAERPWILLCLWMHPIVVERSGENVMSDALHSKKEMILEAAEEIGAQRWTPAEIDQLRRKLIADHGEAAKTGADYIADVLKSAGMKVSLSQREDAEDQFEEEFDDLLHFKTLEDAEVSL